ncbi:tetratricopeptide repeat protein [Ferrimonas sp. SCSIO 43195]|uniref:tetratricopeptide repeat protein n=1 Tax=Ferrimonas sp. SCSIO 43195 TaxID=2822844 RepID=UPI002075CD52|nr:tetratricopeptide repeat protein [Ferrimonas sp. SCSIO 43195]USD36556.1 tetratricopeptide repeat protein [Ferrimonas sp. SCSIO 43195]
MGSIEVAVQQSKRIESKLVSELGAEGRGLHEKLSSCEAQLPKLLVRQIRWIATVRNKAVHEEGFEIDDQQEFVRRCDHVVAQLEQIAEAKSQARANTLHTAKPHQGDGQNWDSPKPSKVGKAILIVLLVAMGLVVGNAAYEDYKKEQRKQARRSLEAVQALNASKKAEREQVKPAASKSTNNATKVALPKGSLADKAKQAQGEVDSAKAELRDQMLFAMMQPAHVTQGTLSVMPTPDGKFTLLVPFTWQLDPAPLLKVANKHFHDYKNRRIALKDVIQPKRRQGKPNGFGIRRIWNQGEHQRHPYSADLFQWLVKHQLALEASFGGQQAQVLLAQGQDCFSDCKNKGDDQFTVLTTHLGQRMPLLNYKEANPIAVTGLNLNQLSAGAELTLSLVLRHKGKEIRRVELSKHGKAIDWQAMTGKGQTQWQQATESLQHQVLGTIKDKTQLTVGELEIRPADDRHSDLLVPISWTMAHQPILDGLNRDFHTYNRGRFVYQQLQEGRFGQKRSAWAVKVEKYANSGERKKRDYSEQLYRELLKQPVVVKVSAGDYHGKLTLAGGRDCFGRCRFGGDDNYYIQFSGTETVTIKSVPNSLLEQLADLDVQIL